ncbi:uncharacterized protein LOC129573267 isoform X1 [Sitodiplosis mosellana]|uniref:uncharacterized protein LOC129573267 isoform X1 n=1 Tax=Sitodiplosis mosellana TaxID=263140 RepID=UPI002443F179|nr:uncharacterized protein LOC129573267 isoform X1 [Sitodiplosis mosellana]
MAAKQSIIIASVLLLVIFVEQGSAIKCFECNSHYNQGCELDLVPSNFSVDCSLKQDRDDRNKPIQYTICRKVLQVIEFSVNQYSPLFSDPVPANVRVIRSCGYDARTYSNTCYKRHGFGGRQIVCACDQRDNCNHSNSLKSPIMLIALFSAIVGFLSH